MRSIKEWIRNLFEKFLSIFNKKKSKQKEILRAVNTYNESNLGLLLNSFAFIASVKKIHEMKGDVNHEGQ